MSSSEAAMRTVHLARLRFISRTAITALLSLIVPALAHAQTDTLPDHDWTHCSTLRLAAGVASADSEAGAGLGGGFGWTLNRRLALNADAVWFDRPAGEERFAGGVTAEVALADDWRVLPYVDAGFGVSIASFDLAKRAPSDFYDRRIAEDERSTGVTRTFADPAFIVGAGAKALVTRTIEVRPGVSAIVAWRDGRTAVTTLVSVGVNFHLENRAITPDRRSR
jgi:hypothetical protein